MLYNIVQLPEAKARHNTVAVDELLACSVYSLHFQYIPTGIHILAILKAAQDQVSRRGAIEEHFFQSRTIVLTGEITHQLAQRVTEHMLALAETSDDPINMIISSPGGACGIWRYGT